MGVISYVAGAWKGLDRCVHDRGKDGGEEQEQEQQEQNQDLGSRQE